MMILIMFFITIVTDDDVALLPVLLNALLFLAWHELGDEGCVAHLKIFGMVIMTTTKTTATTITRGYNNANNDIEQKQQQQ